MKPDTVKSAVALDVTQENVWHGSTFFLRRFFFKLSEKQIFSVTVRYRKVRAPAQIS